jgi:hypothetical protein
MLKQTFGEGVDDRAATLSNPWPRGPKHIYHVMGRRAGSRTRPRAGTTPRESARSPRRSAAGLRAARGRPRPRCAAGPRVRACRIGIMCGIWRDLLHAADDFRIVSGYRRYRRVRVRSPRDASVSVSVTHRSVSESPGCIPSACGTSGAAMRVRLKVAG